MLHAVPTLAQRVHPSPYGRRALADIQIQPLHKGGLDLSAPYR
jgi:hypothetical protein